MGGTWRRLLRAKAAEPSSIVRVALRGRTFRAVSAIGNLDGSNSVAPILSAASENDEHIRNPTPQPLGVSPQVFLERRWDPLLAQRQAFSRALGRTTRNSYD